MEEGTSLDGKLSEFLLSLPARGWLRTHNTGRRHRWPGPRVVVALSPRFAQIKRLTGLPPVADTSVVAAMVREGAHRFFLVNGCERITGGIRIDADGGVWAAAYESAVVASVQMACRAAGWRLHQVVPVAAVLPHVCSGERIRWDDGAWSIELTVAAGELVAIRRSPSGGIAAWVGAAAAGTTVASSSNGNGARDSASTPIPGLAHFGNEGSRFTAAYAAAAAPTPQPVGLSPARVVGQRYETGRPLPLRRLAVAGVTALLAIAAAAAVPGVLAQREAARASAELEALAPERARAADVERELRRVTGALGDADEFLRTRRTMTGLLAAFTDALPEGTALVALRVDSAGGTAVVLGRRATALAGALEQVPWIASPELVGPVTREVLGSPGMYGPSSGAPGGGGPHPSGAAGPVVEVERATIRFRFANQLSVARDDRS